MVKVGQVLKFIKNLDKQIGSGTEYHVTDVEENRIRVSWVIEEMENGWDSQWVKKTGVEQLITCGDLMVIQEGPKFTMTHKFI